MPGTKWKQMRENKLPAEEKEKRQSASRKAGDRSGLKLSYCEKAGMKARHTKVGKPINVLRVIE